MIICPACKEEIEDGSYYCDQCGQALLYCNQCHRVGIGRRCIYCGGLMVAPKDNSEQAALSQDGNQFSASLVNAMSNSFSQAAPVAAAGALHSSAQGGASGLTLSNDTLNIHIVGTDGAIIGRRQGPYTQFFESQPYVSGAHAQLKRRPNGEWCVIDKHSSNGTKLNQRVLQPDVEMTISNGDILTIANVNLQVIVR
ncbi:MAG: FHA domain-containing protein [Prevotella sp.]|nr:FHA domain-containing protein [Prevotella sp.]